MSSWTIYLLVIALIAAVASAGFLYAFVRPVPSQAATGRLTAKTHQDAQTLTRLDAGPRRELWGTSQRKIPEGYLLQIDMDAGGELRYPLEKVAAERLQIGERVKVTYQDRGIPGLWTKRYVSALERLPH